jgi:hypothetical protein
MFPVGAGIGTLMVRLPGDRRASSLTPLRMIYFLVIQIRFALLIVKDISIRRFNLIHFPYSIRESSVNGFKDRQDGYFGFFLTL